jgi:hypothetical protein
LNIDNLYLRELWPDSSFTVHWSNDYFRKIKEISKYELEDEVLRNWNKNFI